MPLSTDESIDIVVAAREKVLSLSNECDDNMHIHALLLFRNHWLALQASSATEINERRDQHHTCLEQLYNTGDNYKGIDELRQLIDAVQSRILPWWEVDMVSPAFAVALKDVRARAVAAAASYTRVSYRPSDAADPALTAIDAYIGFFESRLPRHHMALTKEAFVTAQRVYQANMAEFTKHPWTDLTFRSGPAPVLDSYTKVVWLSEKADTLAKGMADVLFCDTCS